MIRLSVIIVNYNVKYFLEQAVRSVMKACEHIPAEIIIVDNNSVDGSVELIRSKFSADLPAHISLQLIANTENTGFSKANNQGIKIAAGDYILLLNPDTVVEEDTFTKCIGFMDAHPDAGGLGVKMIDGKGNFLPESKRAFPSPEVAFYKAFGLSSLFPKSKIFGKYHLGYLSENATHEVDVLAGAFMLIRKSVLDQIGYLDEAFFMYGEDIDISYRIVQAGYKNYYFPETRIIHYKGESTKKASFNYVKMFYTAMKIFAVKHFSGSRAGMFVALLNIAIYFRGLLSAIHRIFKNIALPLCDAALIFGGLFLVKEYWEYYIKYIEGGQYPVDYLIINVPIYICIWIISIYLSGGYDRTATLGRIVRGIFWGTLVIAALYGFLPEQLRFSRGMIIAGAASTTFLLTASRLFFHFIRYKNLRFGEAPNKKILIVGSPEETERAHQLLNRLQLGNQIIGDVHSGDQANNSEFDLGDIRHLSELVEVYKANELIFCARDVSSNEIINWMVRLGHQADFKIIPEQSLSIIGSNSKNTAGDIYTVDIQLRISQPDQQRSKRLFDISISLACLITFPLTIFAMRNKKGYFLNIFAVLLHHRTWVGYMSEPSAAQNGNTTLPALPKGVLTPMHSVNSEATDLATAARINFIYARDYQVSTDLEIVFSGFRELGTR